MKAKKTKLQKRSYILRVVREDKMFSHKVEKPLTGKGSYKRKGKFKKWEE